LADSSLTNIIKAEKATHPAALEGVRVTVRYLSIVKTVIDLMQDGGIEDRIKPCFALGKQSSALAVFSTDISSRSPLR
jgi:hypothetical protein